MIDYYFSDPIRIGGHTFVGLVLAICPVGGDPEVFGRGVFGNYRLVDSYGREWCRDDVDLLDVA